MKPMKMLLAAASLLFACQAGAADGILGWNTTKKDWVKIRASASGFMFSGQDANDYLTLYSATTATTGAKPVQALPVGAYRVRATVTGSGAVSSTIEVYCNNTEANTGGTQQSTDIVLSDTDADTDVLAADITTACPYIYVEVDAVSASSALNIVAIPIYSSAGATADTELPAAAAAADNFANPTTTNVMGMCMVWDGAAWDRCPGNSASGLNVTIVDSSGDSAMDDTNDAVKVVTVNAADYTTDDFTVYPVVTSGTCSDDGDIDTIETICSVTLSGYYSRCTFQGTNATAALSDFNTDLSNDGSTFSTVATQASDYTAPLGPIVGASGDLTTLDTSTTMYLVVDVDAWHTIRLQAAGTNSNTAIKYMCAQ